MATAPPSSCTAATMARWCGSSDSSFSTGAHSSMRPSALGATPPVRIKRGFAAGALAIERHQPPSRPIQRLEPRVHGAHDDAVAQLKETEVMGRKQMGVGRINDLCRGSGSNRKPYASSLEQVMRP